MDFKELIKLRQSNRSYQDRVVEKEKIEQRLEAGRLSPSANNAQGWTFVTVDDAELKACVAESAYRKDTLFDKKRFGISFLLLVLIQSSVWSQFDYQRIRISNDIELIKLSEKTYVHVSVSEMEGFGKVSSNGLVVVNDGEAFLFDTPTTDYQTETLVTWLADSLKARVTTFVPNHWHGDCLGGLEYLHSKGIKSFANQLTIIPAKENGMPVPQHGFVDSLRLNLHGLEAICHYLGGGHSADNIVVWIPSEKILFGGCMVKDIHSNGLGNLSDAKMEEWLPTIQKVAAKFPHAEIIIPGHGQIGGKELLEHTKMLLRKYQKNKLITAPEKGIK